jgi:hypothetical protein
LGSRLGENKFSEKASLGPKMTTCPPLAPPTAQSSHICLISRATPPSPTPYHVNSLPYLCKILQMPEPPFSPTGGGRGFKTWLSGSLASAGDFLFNYSVKTGDKNTLPPPPLRGKDPLPGHSSSAWQFHARALFCSPTHLLY